MRLCDACSLPGTLGCAGCKKSVAYCSKEHQVLMWGGSHCNHCKRTDGVFFQPKLKELELLDFGWTILQAQSDEVTDAGNKAFQNRIAGNFTDRVAGMFQNLPRLPAHEMSNTQALVALTKHLAHAFFVLDDELEGYQQAVNYAGVRRDYWKLHRDLHASNQCTCTKDRGKSDTPYSHMPKLNVAKIQGDPTGWVNTTSRYSFLLLNFLTVDRKLKKANVHESEASKIQLEGLWKRFLAEAERMKVEGGMEYFAPGAHEELLEFFRTV